MGVGSPACVPWGAGGSLGSGWWCVCNVKLERRPGGLGADTSGFRGFKFQKKPLLWRVQPSMALLCQAAGAQHLCSRQLTGERQRPLKAMGVLGGGCFLPFDPLCHLLPSGWAADRCSLPGPLQGPLPGVRVSPRYPADSILLGAAMTSRHPPDSPSENPPNAYSIECISPRLTAALSITFHIPSRQRRHGPPHLINHRPPVIVKCPISL